jgi:hypothetical protein
MKFAFATGPIGAKTILDPKSGVTSKQGEKLFDKNLALQLEMDEALLAPLDTAQNKVRFLTMAMDIRCRQERLKLESRRLELRAEEIHRQERGDEQRRAQAEHRARHEAMREEERLQKRRDKDLQERRRQDLLLARDLVREQWQQHVQERAAQSPLAQLCWKRSAPDVPQEGWETEKAQPALSVPISPAESREQSQEVAA